MLPNRLCWQHTALRQYSCSAAVCYSLPNGFGPSSSIGPVRCRLPQASLDETSSCVCTGRGGTCCAGPTGNAVTPSSSPKPTIVQGASRDFAGAPSNQFVKPGETLTYQGSQLSRLADVFSYSYQASQPYVNQAVGYVLWPSIVLAPNASVSCNWCMWGCGGRGEGSFTCTCLCHTA
jgi:hypothetical protein